MFLKDFPLIIPSFMSKSGISNFFDLYSLPLPCKKEEDKVNSSVSTRGLMHTGFGKMCMVFL